MYKQKGRQRTRERRREKRQIKKYKCVTLSNEVLLSPKGILQTAKKIVNLTIFYV